MSREAFDVALAVVGSVREHDLEYPAASLAYYGFISLFPVLVLGLGVLGGQTALEIQRAMPPFLTPDARQLVYESTADGVGRTGAVLLSVVALAWCGANLTAGFRSAVERAEGGLGESWTARARDAACVLGSLGLAAATVVATSVRFSMVASDSEYAPIAVAVISLLVGLTVSFLPLYYVPSHLVTSLREAVPGAAVAAVGWTALLGVTHVYAVNAEQYAVYGVISGIIIVLSSLYAAALVLLGGVVLNATLARRGTAGD